MALSFYSKFRVQELASENSEPKVLGGLFALMTELGRDGAKALSISDASAPLGSTGPELDSSDREYSVWVRYGATWRFAVIGAATLEDVADALIERIQMGDADEIRLCPPGTPVPKRLS